MTVVFATRQYRDMVGAWIEHARRVGCLNYRIVCMDVELLDALREEGDRAVFFWDVLPAASEERIDSPSGRRERLAWLTQLRTRFFAHLAAHGIDFLHSDADALWLGDPRPWLLQRKRFDLLFSQGTTHPWTHFKAAGFTVCAGFFFARASARTQAFFEAAERMAARHPSDQLRFNELLLRGAADRWRIEAPRLALAPSRTRLLPNGELYRPWRYARWGPRVHALAARALQNQRSRSWTRAALRAAGRLCMVTSAEVMTRQFTDGLTVGVIPMRLVERVPLADRGDVLVSHLAKVRRDYVN